MGRIVRINPHRELRIVINPPRRGVEADLSIETWAGVADAGSFTRKAQIFLSLRQVRSLQRKLALAADELASLAERET